MTRLNFSEGSEDRARCEELLPKGKYTTETSRVHASNSVAWQINCMADILEVEADWLLRALEVCIAEKGVLRIESTKTLPETFFYKLGVKRSSIRAISHES